MDTKPKDKIQIVFFFDKEETGSAGDTGAKSIFVEDIYETILSKIDKKLTLIKALVKTDILSSDVTAGINPNFKSVHDENNASILGHGISIEKYGGSGGKYSTNDSSAEYMSHIIDMMEKNKIVWQTGELGKIDSGGGGTIAQYFSNRGARAIDAGTPVIGMHSPYEIVSKVDVYNTYQAYKVFLEN